MKSDAKSQSVSHYFDDRTQGLVCNVRSHFDQSCLWMVQFSPIQLKNDRCSILHRLTTEYLLCTDYNDQPHPRTVLCTSSQGYAPLSKNHCLHYYLPLGVLL